MPMSKQVSSSLVLDESSFQGETPNHTGGLIEFKVEGVFLHFNTIEEYQAFDYKLIENDPSLLEKYDLPNLEEKVL